jgi:hypothetical protein
MLAVVASTFSVLVKRAYNDSAVPTSTELKSMLNNGVTPVAVSETDNCYIARSVTTYCKNGSNYDYRARDSIVVAVGDKFVDDLVAKLAAAPWTKVTTDPPEGGKEPPADFATPKRVKAIVETLVFDYRDAGWLDPGKVADLIASIQVGQDPVVPSRMNISLPPPRRLQRKRTPRPRPFPTAVDRVSPADS